MTEQNLKCNFPKCKNRVDDIATVTRCSHIFCKDHAIEGEDYNRRCPACREVLNGNHDISKNHVNPSEEMKTVMLRGYAPDMVFEAMKSGIQFWEYQKNMELKYQNIIIDHLQSRLAKKESDLEIMHLKNKHSTQTYENKINSLKNEVESLTNTVKELDYKLNEKSRLLLNMQSRYESLRNECTARFVNKAIEEPMEKDDINPLFNRHRFSNQEPPASTSNFIFRPNTPRHTPHKLTPVNSKENQHKIQNKFFS